MTDRDIVVPSGIDSLTDIVELTTYAEELGYDRVSLPEVTGRDGVTVLATLAERTDTIGLSNDVFSPYARTPAMLGQTGVSLQEASDGRYRMGLGTSSPDLTEKWHLAEFDRPLRYLRETIEIVRQVTAGERVDYDGEFFDGGGLQLHGVEPTEVPIDVAALGPKAVELAGRFGDGWVPQLFSTDALETRLGDFHRGADLGGRDPADLRVAVTVRSCALEDRERARDVARQQLGFMVGAYGPYYRQSIAEQGFDDATNAIRDAWTDGDRGEAVDAVTDEMIDALVAVGTPDEVISRVKAYEAIDGVDAVRIGFFGGQTAEEREATLDALTPADD